MGFLKPSAPKAPPPPTMSPDPTVNQAQFEAQAEDPEAKKKRLQREGKSSLTVELKQSTAGTNTGVTSGSVKKGAGLTV